MHVDASTPWGLWYSFGFTVFLLFRYNSGVLFVFIDYLNKIPNPFALFYCRCSGKGKGMREGVRLGVAKAGGVAFLQSGLVRECMKPPVTFVFAGLHQSSEASPLVSHIIQGFTVAVPRRCPCKHSCPGTCPLLALLLLE